MRIVWESILPTNNFVHKAASSTSYPQQQSHKPLGAFKRALLEHGPFDPAMFKRKKDNTQGAAVAPPLRPQRPRPFLVESIKKVLCEHSLFDVPTHKRYRKVHRPVVLIEDEDSVFSSSFDDDDDDSSTFVLTEFDMDEDDYHCLVEQEADGEMWRFSTARLLILVATLVLLTLLRRTDMNSSITISRRGAFLAGDACRNWVATVQA